VYERFAADFNIIPRADPHTSGSPDLSFPNGVSFFENRLHFCKAPENADLAAVVPDEVALDDCCKRRVRLETRIGNVTDDEFPVNMFNFLLGRVSDGVDDLLYSMGINQSMAKWIKFKIIDLTKRD
jgi:hypothetical protein